MSRPSLVKLLGFKIVEVVDHPPGKYSAAHKLAEKYRYGSKKSSNMYSHQQSTQAYSTLPRPPFPLTQQ
jgi:hypothetical protein